MTTLEHALSYIARGWSIVPLVAGTKRPAVKLAAFLSGAQRMTAEDATAYWTANPEHGIAIVTGAPSGLVVIDVDPRNGGVVDEVRAVCPDTLVARTGSGGAHFFCAMPEGSEVACGKTEKTGVDRKASGGYVVAAPSRHPNGELYAWEAHPDGGQPAALPEWVLRTPAAGPLDDATGEPRGGAWIATTIHNLATCPAGTQHETLVRLSYWLACRHEEDIALELLVGFAEKMPLSRPEQPWTEADCSGLLSSAYAKLKARGVTGPGFATWMGGAQAPQSDVDERTEIRGYFQRASTWVVTERENWIVDGLIAPACYTEVIGEVKKGKTTLITQLMLAVLTGEDFLGRKVRKGPIVVHTEQAGLSLEKTLERAGIRHHPDLHFLTGTKTFGKKWVNTVGAAVDICVAVGSQMLFIDTLTRLAGVEGEGENASGIVSILNPFQEAKAKGIACTFVRHASKALENRSDVSRAGRGSTSLTGEMDVCALLYKPGVEDIRALHVVSRLGEESDQTLQYEGGVYKVLSDGLPGKGMNAVADVKRARVKAAFDEGARGAAAVAKVAGVSRNTAAKYLQEIVGSNMPVTFDDAPADPDDATSEGDA